MSKELDDLKEWLPVYKEVSENEQGVVIQALALILKRQECQHAFVWAYDETILPHVDVTSIGSQTREYIQPRVRLLNKVCANCGLVRVK